ncbi:hypothetical protein [Salipiger abyssi]|nr:hypothetical protein [Salipiger abyssi]
MPLHRPDTLDAALALMGRGGAQALGGGRISIRRCATGCRRPSWST